MGSESRLQHWFNAALSGVDRANALIGKVRAMREGFEWSSRGIEGLAVFIIVASIVFGSLRFVVQWFKRTKDSYRSYKVLLGRSLLLALHFMVAADVIRTVVLDLTIRGLEILGALVVIRTFLSCSVAVELEGHWPWQAVLMAQMDQSGGEDVRPRVLGDVERFAKPDHRPIEIPIRTPAFDGDTTGSA